MDSRLIVIFILLVIMFVFVRIDRSPRRAARARYFRCGGRRG